MQKIILPLLFIGSPYHLIQAQEINDSQTSAVPLPEMVVTATRSVAQASHSLSASATVFDRQRIEALQVKSVPELLRYANGLDVTQNGSYGQLSSVFMRGTNSSHVLVLVDGIKIGSVTAGVSQFELLPIDQIERVEVLRGPQSSLYGSEAIGGVIQIFTRKGKASATPSVSLDAGGGSFYSHRSAGNVSGQIGESWYALGASHFNTQGFDVGAGANQPDADGFDNTAVNARLGHRFGDTTELEAFFMHDQGRNFFDSAYDGGADKSKFNNHVVGLSGNVNVTDRFKSTLRLGQSLEKLDSFISKNNQLTSRFNSTRWNASWINNVQINNENLLILGTDYRVDEIDALQKYVEHSRYDIGVFGEWHSQLLDEHFLNASLRWDNNQAFGDYVTGSMGYRYNWQKEISVMANFGNAFRSPTFNELYWPKDNWGGGGNPLLKPEQSQTVETGILGDHHWGKWELRAYHTDLENLINGWPPVNVGKARIEGIEAQISTQIWQWHPTLSLNLLDPIDAQTGKRLIRRSDKMLNFDLSRSFEQWDVGLCVHGQGKRFDVVFPPPTYEQTGAVVAGFVTLDLRSAYHIDKNWLVSAKINNLLDKHYQTVNTYNMADRNFFVSIHYNN